MNMESEIGRFSGLSANEQARFMARFMYELTLEARQFYSPGGQQQLELLKLRFINEVQHRVTRYIEQILIDDASRPSGDVTLRLLLAPRSEKAIESLVIAAFTRTVQAVA